MNDKLKINDNYTQVKKGYKKTEIGVIPVEWEVKNIDDTSTLKARIGWQGLTTSEYLNNGNYYLVTGTDFDNGKIKWEMCHYVEKIRYTQDINIQLKKEDILITKDGTIGKIAYINNITLPATLNSGVFVIRAKRNNYIPRFLFYVFNSSFFSIFLNELVAGSTINHLYQKNFVNFCFPLPPRPEQKAIAEVLFDTDNLIQSIEKKITKKRLIKKGAMQKLLTSKKDWETKILGQYLVYEQPTKYLVTDTKYNDNYDIPVLTAGKTFVLGLTNEKKGIFEDFPVIIFDDFTTATKFVDFPFKAKSSAMKILNPKNECVNLRFVYEIMQLIDFPLGDHKRHWIGEFQHLEIKVPTQTEQIRIAAILSDMDLEIELLEKKISKYKELKQGLMQNLLTGKIRLV